ncbi:MAG: hypothetical protein JWN70_5070 [Planctomycetaceae bacterium]|nr:hypothetical protein [Planctomycetaceae bacterium]
MRRNHVNHGVAANLAILGLLLLAAGQSASQEATPIPRKSPRPAVNVIREVPAPLFNLEAPAEPPVPPAEKPAVRFLDDGFKKSYLAFDKSFNARLQELTLDDGTPETQQAGTSKGKPGTITVQCCQELANVPRKFVYIGTGTKYLPHRDYQDCFALAAVKFGRAPKQSFFEHGRLGDDLFKSLRREIYWTHRFKEFETRGGIDWLHQLPFTTVNITPTSIELDYKYPDSDRGAHWWNNFDCLAASDFDGDGLEDILVMMDEGPSDGTYLSMHPMIFSRKTEGGKLEVKNSDFLVRCLLACRKMTGDTAK